MIAAPLSRAASEMPPHRHAPPSGRIARRPAARARPCVRLRTVRSFADGESRCFERVAQDGAGMRIGVDERIILRLSPMPMFIVGAHAFAYVVRQQRDRQVKIGSGALRKPSLKSNS